MRSRRLVTTLAGTLAVGTALALASPVTPSSAGSSPGATAHRGARAPQADQDWRGQVLWAEPLRTLTAAQARSTLRAAELDDSRVRHPVAEVRLVYRTVDALGRPTTASGLVALPGGTSGPLRLVSFAHGTTSYRADAPSSTTPDDFSAAPALAYAAAGFAAVAPDYLGLGLGPGTHPYFDIASETSASLDLLRAVRRFAPTVGRSVAPAVDVTGFSQGASAAMALGKVLQDGADPHLRLHALAPVSGAYDFRGAELPALVRGEVPGPLAVAYVAYLLVATDRLHPLYDAPAELFRAPYADRVETLFGGDVPGDQVLRALPDSLDALLTPRGRALLAHPTGGLADALVAIDGTCSWSPAAPTRLLYALGDEQAVVTNTAGCARALRAHGAGVPTVELGPHDYAGSRHLGSAVTGVSTTLAWFHSLR